MPSSTASKIQLSFLIIILTALAGSVYGMIPPYPYWKNCLATGSCFTAAVLFGVTRPSFFRNGRGLLAGLIFSILGDYFMKEGNLVGGIGFFGLGHISFLLFFLKNGRKNHAALAGLITLCTLYIPYFLIRLLPNIAQTAQATSLSPGVLTGAVTFYLTVSILSFSSALTLISRPARCLAAGGIACILFSDTLIAENLFCCESVLYGLMMPAYLATHFFLFLSAVTGTSGREKE